MDFLMSLIDLKFSRFITAYLVRIIYVIMLVLILLGLIGAVISGLFTMFTGRSGILVGLGTICLSPFVTVLYIILARVWTELIMVIFRIAEDLHELVEMKRKGI